ncbi:MAG: hypothetical protein JSS02_05925 [Planctomycetes bacterium]|nr:hypothetical protein [Planctomycetota bacterium]
MNRICRKFRLGPGAWLAVLGIWASLTALSQLQAAEIRLKNGTVIRGVKIDKLATLQTGPKQGKEPNVPYYPIYMVTSPLKRYFVPRSQEDVVNADADLSKPAGFKLEQKKTTGGSRPISAVQGYAEKPTGFDAWGRRKVSLRFANGPETVHQGITLLTPEWATVTALNYSWETAIPTSSIPLPQLDAILRQATKRNNPTDRLNIAVFYIQAMHFPQAEAELRSIVSDFPEMADRAAAATRQLHAAQAMEYLREMKLRRTAGQHSLVYQLCQKFPTEDVEANTLREVRDITKEYETALDRAEKLKADLGELQGQLQKDARVKEIAPLRQEIAEKLNYTNIERIDAYFKLAGDALLKPEEKLALAFSGWVVGSQNAVTDLDQALRFGQARILLIDYLRSKSEAGPERKNILAALESIDGVGPDRIAQMLPLLPAQGDVSGIAPGQAFKIELPTTAKGNAVAYWATLPYEYHADHAYPVIIALHSESGSPQQELQGFWGGTEEQGGQAQRHGYIVIAPEYIPETDSRKGYDYSEASHEAVLASLRDALSRFNIDADRVFLAGHGMGGDAAWDIGLSHPQLFAGVVPINGAIDRFSKYYIENGTKLSFYSVVGEKDVDLFERNVDQLMKIFKNGTDLIHAEYRGAGPETFYAEIHAIFDWMSRMRRDPVPKQLEINTLRESDNSYSWFEFFGIPENLKGIDWNNRSRAIKTFKVSAKITPSNSILISSRASRHRVWIPRGDGLIDLDKRIDVKINSKQVWNNFLKPDVEAMLERVRQTGDRQQLYWGVLDFPIGK